MERGLREGGDNTGYRRCQRQMKPDVVRMVKTDFNQQYECNRKRVQQELNSTQMCTEVYKTF